MEIGNASVLLLHYILQFDIGTPPSRLLVYGYRLKKKVKLFIAYGWNYHSSDH
uniref:Uncharacterized protein n=1 Tax=Nelumbo nucifera TaxID=4432 RepID=A0A822XRQ5_NELNU|nr:TPA_asm: hypothetical protein HUJ06_023242 [Nelumbo nucifera]